MMNTQAIEWNGNKGTVDSSELGLSPGHFPVHITVDGTTFTMRNCDYVEVDDTDIGLIVYKATNALGEEVAITVYND